MYKRNEGLVRLKRRSYENLCLFSFILLLKSVVAWSVVFHDGTNWAIVQTELPFFILVFSLIEWFAAKRKILYYMLVNFCMTLIYFAVIMYYKYYGVIATYHSLKQAKKVTHVGESTLSLLTPYYLFLFVDIALFLVLIILPKYVSIWKDRASRMSRKVLTCTISASFVLCVFNIWPAHASLNEINKAKSMGILNYEVYKVVADRVEKEVLIAPDDISQETIHLTKGSSPLQDEPKFHGINKGMNLVLVQMESFQNFLIDLKIDGQEITPHLNQLIEKNTYFPYFYTNAGQGTTSDAEFVVNTSFYVPKDEPATSSKYMDKKLPSLPHLLKENGYDTATFHTNSVDFWNRNRLYRAIGFERYYDQVFFGEDDPIAFGASDEALYAKTSAELSMLDKQDQPFYAMVISMSAHHPYHLPEEKAKMKLPDRFQDTLMGDYIQAQNYADVALGQFLDELIESGLWDNSVVVFYGDHQGIPMTGLTGKEKELMNSLLGHNYGYTDMMNIPFIVHSPSGQLPPVINTIGGQIDILPTVANLLGIPLGHQLVLGEDLFNQERNLIPLRHFLPDGSFINDKILYMTGNQYADGVHYELSNNRIVEGGSTASQFSAAQRLLDLSNSYLLQLPDAYSNQEK
ncbi:LTA synthase family protein [Paenibacillus sp. ACRSA]|uniref:LTA synthase family protein n=1 Tax=Paenibacillus sp. ACRSA TaxID=2918211 RepID=UPI001EF5D2FD|nr:LTA synthase family protein [Paenibacillus sp. ACRSA]MCG7380035.1 LTA synthase family protein [Paenibacillus sp. ACRSA]